MVLNQILNARRKRIMVDFSFLGALRSYGRGGIIGVDGSRITYCFGIITIWSFDLSDYFSSASQYDFGRLSRLSVFRPC